MHVHTSDAHCRGVERQIVAMFCKRTVRWGPITCSTRCERPGSKIETKILNWGSRQLVAASPLRDRKLSASTQKTYVAGNHPRLADAPVIANSRGDDWVALSAICDKCELEFAGRVFHLMTLERIEWAVCWFDQRFAMGRLGRHTTVGCPYCTPK